MKLRSDAWLLLGLSSLPGELSLSSGWLSYVASGCGSVWPAQLRKLERQVGQPGLAEALEQNQRTLVIRWPVLEVRAWCPWYYFGGGMKLRHQGTQLRLSFGVPGNMVLRGHRAGPAGALGKATAQLREVGVMRRRGKLWHDAIVEQNRRAATAAADDPPLR